MSKTLFATALSLGLLALAPAAIFAQEPSRPADRTISKGDTIEWVAAASTHRVSFNDNDTTSVADIKTILEDFDPDLNAAGDSRQASSGTLLTAKVKDNATEGKTFIFRCGVHPDEMLSEPFTIAPKVDGQLPRTHKIKGVSELHWLLVIPEVHVDTTAP